jgi:hypothetical protein
MWTSKVHPHLVTIDKNPPRQTIAKVYLSS